MNRKLGEVVRCGVFPRYYWILIPLFFWPLAQAVPTWKDELTPPNPGPFARLAPTRLDLQVSWKGMVNSGSVRIEFSPRDAKSSGSYVIRSSASSTGPAAVIFPYQSNFWSELHPATLRPRYFHAVETDKKEKVITEVRHFPNRVESHEVSQILKSGTTKQTDRTFAFTPIFDVFSAMLHIRSQKLDVGDRITIVLCPFSTPYLLRTQVIAHEFHNGRSAIHLNLGMQKIDRKTLELLPYIKLKKNASLWLSNDADRVPIELRAAVFIGDVRATLTDHQKL
jgi:Protein of unknown function (DUF3108)